MTAKENTPAKRIIRGLYNWPPEFKPCIATIGNFDGLHKGHDQTLQLLLVKAGELALPSVVVVVETAHRGNPNGVSAPIPLMVFRDKIRRILDRGIDRVLVLRLSSHLKLENIIRQLIKALKLRCLVSGDEFHLGRSATYNLEKLLPMSRSEGFSLIHSKAVLHQQELITSERVSQAIVENQFSLATELLGRPFALQGKVVRGQQLGSSLGWPTANLSNQRGLYPLSGVFAVLVKLPNGQTAQGVANIGTRPTVGDLVRPILEVHILDFNQDIYGQYLEVAPLHKIREEIKFSSLEALKSAIADDIKKAKDYFAAEKQAGIHD